VELIEIVVELEKELEEFQRTFENDENLEIQFIVKILYKLLIIFYTSLVLFFYPFFNYDFLNKL
jgi:hypothetical protein